MTAPKTLQRSTAKGEQRRKLAGTEFIHDPSDSVLMAYLRAVMEWHGYVRFIQLPKDNPDVPLSDLFVEPLVAARALLAEADGPSDSSLMPALDALAQNRFLVLLGDPGSGKSTLVNWTAYQLAVNQPTPYKDRLGPLIPVPMVLRELGVGPGVTWESLLGSFLQHRMVRDVARLRPALERWLADGQAYLMLDGVDEIGSAEVRRELRQAAFDGALVCNRGCRWLVTSRIVGYEDVPFNSTDDLHDAMTSRVLEAAQAFGAEPRPDAGRPEAVRQQPAHAPDLAFGDRAALPTRLSVAVYYVAPFDDVRVATYARKWFGIRDYARDRANEWADQFGAALRASRDSMAIARNPNMLSLAALIYRVRARLPHGRAELYREIVEAYVQAIDEYRGLVSGQDPPVEEKRRWLARIGFEMQKRRAAESDTSGRDAGTVLAADEELKTYIQNAMRDSGGAWREDQALEFLSFIKRRSGLLIPRGADPGGREMYAYVHLSFQEYFAALCLEEQVCSPRWISTGEAKVYGADMKSMRAYAAEAAWQETLVLLFEILAPRQDWVEYIAEALFGAGFAFVTEPGSPLPAAELLARLSIDPHSGFDPKMRDRAIGALGKRIVEAHSGEDTSPIMRVLFGGESAEHAAVWERLLKSDAFRGLARLDLSGSRISDLSPLAELAGLTDLDVTATNVTDLSPLAGLTSLTVLQLSLTEVTDLSPLAGLTELTELDASAIQVSDLSPLKGLTGLTVLNVSRTQVTDLSPLKRLTGLTVLNLSRTQVTDLSPLDALTTLTDLDVSSTQVTDLSPLAGLTGLIQLDVSFTQLSDLSPLKGLTKLKMLKAWHTMVSDVSPLRDLARLEILDLDSTPVSNLLPLAGLTNLARLYLRFTQVTDLSPVRDIPGLHIIRL